MCAVAIVLVTRHQRLLPTLHFPRFLLLLPIWAVLYLASAIFSSSIPLTLFAVFGQLLGWSVFLFFLTLTQQFKVQFFLKLLILLALALTLISLVFEANHSLGSLLPGMNLLYTTYGHNHIAVILLMVIPLSWWLAFQKTRRSVIERSIAWIIPVFFSVVLLLTLARVGILIGFLQMLAVFLITSRHREYFTGLAGGRIIFKSLFVFFLSSLVVLGFFWFMVTTKPGFSCPLNIIHPKLCFSIQTDTRTWYWERAVKIAQHQPWLGSGPGTFTEAHKLYRQNPFADSQFVHNSFLQMFAESGVIVGSLYSLLILLLLLTPIKSIFAKSGFTWEKAVYISAAGLFINSLFDFDFDFIGVYAVFLAFLALIQRNHWATQPQGRLSQKIVVAIKSWWLGFTVFSLIIAGFFIFTELQIALNRPSAAFAVFPYFSHHYNTFQKSNQIQPREKQQLRSIYRNHPQLYLDLLQGDLSLDERLALQNQLVAIDPWQRLYQDYVGDLILAQQNTEAAREVAALRELYQILESQSLGPRRETKVELAMKMLTLGDQFAADGNANMAGYLYREARFADPWLLDDHQPFFINQPVSAKEYLTFISYLSDVEGKYLGRYRDAFVENHISSLETELQENFVVTIQELPPSISLVLRHDDRLHKQLWDRLAPIINNNIKLQMEQQDWPLAYYSTLFSWQTYELLASGGQELDFALKEEYGITQLDLADRFQEIDADKAQVLYQQVHALLPWILASRGKPTPS